MIKRLNNFAWFLKSSGQKYLIMCYEIYLVGNAGDETFDVQLRGTRLLAGRVRAFETPGRLPQGCSFAQGRVFDVVKVVVQARTRLSLRKGQFLYF